MGCKIRKAFHFSKSCPVMETSVIVFTIYTKYGIIFATGILSFFSFLPRFGCFQIIYMLEIIGAVAGKYVVNKRDQITFVTSVITCDKARSVHVVRLNDICCAMHNHSYRHQTCNKESVRHDRPSKPIGAKADPFGR